MPDRRRPIRVLVVDDSAVMRKVLRAALEHDPDVEVVATAVDGAVALRKLVRFRPDVVTLDLEMPGMGGLDVLREIVSQDGTPVIVVSALTARDAALAATALSMGAVDVVPKPTNVFDGGLPVMMGELLAKLHAVAGRRLRGPAALPQFVPHPLTGKRQGDGPARRVLAIAASTGGPAALSYLLPRLPADLAAAVLVVQHMPAGFTEMLASRLDQACSLTVEEARDGEPLRHGRVLVARGGRHLRVSRTASGPLVVMGNGPQVSGHRPSADVLFTSVAEHFGPESVAVVLTGMGEDGAAGLLALRQASAVTFAQDEESSVVYGMPRAAMLRGAVEHVLPLERLPEAILSAVRRKAHREPAAALAGARRGEAR